MGNVIVLGSLHLDIVVQATRMPTLGETLMGSGWQQIPGGKGLNQAVSCSRAGLSTQMLGLVGNDDFAKTMLTHLQHHDVDTSQVLHISTCGSGMSVAIVQADGDYSAVVASEANAQIDANNIAAWSGHLESASALVLQNEIPAPANMAAAKIVSQHGGLVVLNAAPARYAEPEFLQHVKVLVVNSVEAEMMGSQPVVDLASAQAASKFLHNKYGPDVVVTAGKDGAAWTGAQAGSNTVKALPVKVISAHGAGDMFVGRLVAELIRKSDLGDAVRSANEAAARHVSTPRE